MEKVVSPVKKQKSAAPTGFAAITSAYEQILEEPHVQAVAREMNALLQNLSAPGATVAVSVAAWLKPEGFGVAATSVVVAARAMVSEPLTKAIV